MTNYHVTASEKANAAANIEFVVVDHGYKQAWINARNICRIGGAVKLVDGVEKEIAASAYIVRSIFTVDSRVKNKPRQLTAAELVAAAAAAGVKISPKLQALIDAQMAAKNS